MAIEVRIHKEVEPKEPVLISGLSGAGMVGRNAVEYLVRKMKAELIATLYSTDSLAVRIENGTTKPCYLEINELLFANVDGKDFLFYKGDQPMLPEKQKLFVEKVLEIARKYGVKKIISLAADVLPPYISMNKLEMILGKPKVSVAANKESLLPQLQKYGVNIASKGVIGGMNGLMVGLEKEIDSYCLMAETLFLPADMNASCALLEVLTKMLDLKVDITDIKKEKEEMVKRIRSEIKEGYYPKWQPGISEEKPSYIA